MLNGFNQNCSEEDIRKAVLNDQPFTYTPAEFDEMDPLTPTHLLYGRRVTSLPYESVRMSIVAITV